MATSDFWNKAAAPAGYDGDCYSRGNYLAVSAWEGKYRLTWNILRRQDNGECRQLPESRGVTQTFALRPVEQSDIEHALRWAEHQIVMHRARRKSPESGIQ